MKQILQKIAEDILERSMKNNFVPMSQMGDSSHEFDYKFYTSTIPELDGFILVISKALFYHNSSLQDFKRKYYVYDSDGNYVAGDSFVKSYPNFMKTVKPIVLNENLS